MALFGDMRGIVQEVKAFGLGILNCPMDGRASILDTDLSRQSLPAREGLGVLVKGNPDHTAYFAPIASGTGMGSMSFATASALVNGTVSPPPPFMIITNEDGKRSTALVSQERAIAYSRVIAEMVEASQSHRLDSLPNLEEIGRMRI